MPFSLRNIKSICYQSDITFDIKLDHLAAIVFVRFLHCEVTLFPSLFFHTVFAGGGGWERSDEVTIKACI